MKDRWRDVAVVARHNPECAGPWAVIELPKPWWMAPLTSITTSPFVIARIVTPIVDHDPGDEDRR